MRNLTIFCPPMGVVNTGYWWQVFADRVTDELVCRGQIDGGGPGLTITFPPCVVRNVQPGRWMVDPVVAKGKLDTGEYLQISYPEEPVIRQGKYLYAQEVESIAEDSYVLCAEFRAQVWSKLPLAKSSPVGLGLKKFIVEAVTLPGPNDPITISGDGKIIRCRDGAKIGHVSADGEYRITDADVVRSLRRLQDIPS